MPLVLFLPFVGFLIEPCGVLEEVAVENVSYWLCVALASIKGASSSPLSLCGSGRVRPAPTGMLRFCTIVMIAKRAEILRAPYLLYTRCAPRTASGVSWGSGREAQKARALPEEASLPCLWMTSFGRHFCWVAERWKAPRMRQSRGRLRDNDSYITFICNTLSTDSRHPGHYCRSSKICTEKWHMILRAQSRRSAWRATRLWQAPSFDHHLVPAGCASARNSPITASTLLYSGNENSELLVNAHLHRLDYRRVNPGAINCSDLCPSRGGLD